MPNSYSVVPNVLPGNVTIGGNLIVGGDQVTIGAAVPKVRIGKDTFSKAILSYNLGFDDLTLDTNADLAQAMGLNVQGTGYVFERHNAAGFPQTLALSCPIFTDYTQHAHTGTVTEDTIYSKVIRGGIIGANGGLHIRMFLSASAQGAPATTFRFRFGAVLCESDAITATSARWYEFYLWNQNAANSNRHLLRVHNLTTNALSNANGTDTFDFSVDQTLNISVQNGTATDTQTFLTVGAQLINSFGPV